MGEQIKCHQMVPLLPLIEDWGDLLQLPWSDLMPKMEER